MAAKKRSTADFYKKNPEAYAKKLAYDKKRNSSAKAKKYRAELARERRKRGIMGKGGPDVSHTKNGGFKLRTPARTVPATAPKKDGPVAYAATPKPDGIGTLVLNNQQ